MITDTFSPLVLRAQAGDRDAFSDLVVLFESRIFGIVMQRLRKWMVVSDRRSVVDQSSCSAT
jgi:hypothetical protein